MVQELIRLCEGRKIYIQTHNVPDPDAIASAYGLQQLLLPYGISSILCYEGSIDNLSTSRMLKEIGIRMYSYEEICRTMKEGDPIICVDSQKNNGNITDFIGDEIACVDHHPTYVKETYQYVDIRITGACATLIAGYYMELGRLPDEDTATALLYGLKMDTLQFTRGVTQLDIQAFHFLFPLCNQSKLSRLEHNHIEFQDLKAYGAAIENIQVYGTFGFTAIPFACPDALVATLADFILSLDQVEAAAVISSREDGIKLSVRSEFKEVHAGQLIRRVLEGFGSGGGHASMAGGMIPKENIGKLGPFYENTIRDRFLKELLV
ncbi:MAG: DHHA1 domain-containing protein [Roseburia sp.]|nr:DHHA1 domain-containing protein [Roseburia sp.]